ncbi:hypothetical protein ABEV54_18065, partial [Peribacillus psychrosaccharolyticus]|uniref:hypothetical protein n=1 Tax=Peribacillus psychrosaccharolyticus TaxID=1407 RepID=UPI003D2BC2DB
KRRGGSPPPPAESEAPGMEINISILKISPEFVYSLKGLLFGSPFCFIPVTIPIISFMATFCWTLLNQSPPIKFLSYLPVLRLDKTLGVAAS